MITPLISGTEAGRAFCMIQQFNFQQSPYMTLPHDAGTATLLKDGRVLVAGGYHGAVTPFAFNFGSAELYDPATGKSSMLVADVVRRRDLHRATLLRDGRVLIT